MAADDQRGAEPVTFAGGVLDRYRHVCAFVNQRSDQDGVFDSFISQGIDGGDRLLYVVDPAESAAPVNRLRHSGMTPRSSSSTTGARCTRGPTPT